MAQWSLFIDIEGFGETYEAGSQGIVSLGALMQGIYSLGSLCFPESPNRIFAHQIGDGFIVVSEFPKDSLDEPVSVAVLLLRQIALAGGAGKAAISEGGFADVVGCYPKVIQRAMGPTHGGAFPLGGGVMTIFPVMGTALINAYRLISGPRVPSGSILLIPKADVTRLPDGVLTETCGEYVAVDWVHASLPRVQQLASTAQLKNPNAEIMEQFLARYLKQNKVSQEWRANTIHYLHLSGGTPGSSETVRSKAMTTSVEQSSGSAPASQAQSAAAQSHYDQLFGYFRWLVSSTFAAAAAVIAIGAFFFYQNVSEMKSDAKAKIEAAADSAREEIARIGEQASAVALTEARSRVDEAFRKEEVASMVKTAAQRQVGPAIEAQVSKEIERAAQRIQLSVEAMGQIADLAMKMRLGLREGLDELKRMTRDSASSDVQRQAKSILKSICKDYENVRMSELAETKASARSLLAQQGKGTLAEIISEIQFGQDLSRVSMAYLALREVTGISFSMFDVDQVESWCKSQGSECKWIPQAAGKS